jgi:hypothetical protein
MSDRAGAGTHFGTIGTLDRRFRLKLFSQVLGDITLTQEGDGLVLNDKRTTLKIDAGLVSAKHVQTEEQVDLLPFHDGEGAGQEHLADLDLGRVNTAQDRGGPDALGDAAVATVYQAHYVTRCCTLGRHDGHLSAGVDEGV